MWFLLRCVFWLSIVFASIFWSKGPAVWTRGKVTHEVQGILGQTRGMARAEAEKTCLRSPAACLEAVAHLNRLAAGRGLGGEETKLPRSAVVDGSAAAN
jgi:hypothetical protein